MKKIKEILSEIIEEKFGHVVEASLSRLISRTTGSDFCIATGFRSNLSFRQNKERNKQILQQLNSHKMGGYLLIGHWQEAPDGVEFVDATTDQLIDSLEESILFVKTDNLSREAFIEICVQIARKFNQDAVIIGLSNVGVFLYYKDGTYDKVGSKMTLGKTAQAYSQMRNKPNVPFVFEGNLHPINNFGRQMFDLKNILYVK